VLDADRFRVEDGDALRGGHESVSCYSNSRIHARRVTSSSIVTTPSPGTTNVMPTAGWLVSARVSSAPVLSMARAAAATLWEANTRQCEPERRAASRRLTAGALEPRMARTTLRLRRVAL